MSPPPTQQAYADDNARERLVQEVKRLADVLEDRESQQPSAQCQLVIKGIIQQSLDNIFSAIRSTNDHVKMLSDSILRIEKDIAEFQRAQKMHEEMLRGSDGRGGMVGEVRDLKTKTSAIFALGMAAIIGAATSLWKLFFGHVTGVHP